MATPNNYDVYFGRGRGFFDNPGNKKWRKLIEENLERYEQTVKERKKFVALEIVNHMRNQNPPGRFLITDEKSNRLKEVGNEEAVKRCRAGFGNLISRLKEVDIQLALSNEVARPIIESPANEADIELAWAQFEREVRKGILNEASSGTAMTSLASALVRTSFKIEEAIPSLEIVHKKRLKEDREYTGSVLTGAAHGCGCMIYDDGRIASGNFLNGVLHGHACLIFGDGSMYFGNFWKHKREGKGTYIYQDGSNYVGDFSRDKRHGRGRYVSKENNQTYDGQFKDGKFEGYGFVLGVNGKVEQAGRFENWKLVEDVEDMKAANQDPKVAVQNLLIAEQKKAFEEQEAAKSPNELVVESWAAVTKIPGYQIVAGKILFRRIFELNGDALALFSFGKNYKPDDDALYKDPIFTEHSTAVVSSVATAVNLLERGDMNGLISVLKELGDQYAQFNFTKADYDLVVESFLYALKKALGDAFTPRVKQSWIEVYDVISQLLGLVPQRPKL